MCPGRRQETLVKIDARKARIAAATAKLVKTPISTYRCKPVQKVAVPAAIECNSAGATPVGNSETAVPAADQNQVLEGGEGVRTAPTVLLPKGIFPLPTMNPPIY